MDGMFPKLRTSEFKETSPRTPTYNCIAWAVGDNQKWWWPDSMNNYYWPSNVKREETIDAFSEAFHKIGYDKCADGSLETGYQKIAFYELNGKITHAARQLKDGRWASKIGSWEDIEHDLVDGLEGQKYGVASYYMRRPLTQQSSVD